MCVCASLWFALLLCVPVRACAHICMRACVLLCGCLLPGQYFYFQEVLPVLAAKHCIMQANAELHQSALAKQKARYGEEIARLQVRLASLPPSTPLPPSLIHIFHPLSLFSDSSRQHAAELVKTVASRYDEYVSVKDLNDRINRALTAAKKDNNLIYNDRVPEIKELEHIGKAALVKAAPITPPLSQKFTGETQHKNKYITLVYKLRARKHTSSASWHPV